MVRLVVAVLTATVTVTVAVLTSLIGVNRRVIRRIRLLILFMRRLRGSCCQIACTLRLRELLGYLLMDLLIPVREDSDKEVAMRYKIGSVREWIIETL
ncbi:hypothetical protein HanXRQr2_Chr03g0126881 [Helianthus annuus]|uniref:Uncharacterized protein n=1 Tax=Helianthus annuus TaxID=4232 RepID=A0A251VAQ1_HELAN|nr:hypothetical protein HanXRQr2_Chr03g0126881 [Helianthus annuus]KAJ0945037.1 hypothetical protein HanPSC8_Chr03g0123501 [Helianthus annuus]